MDETIEWISVDAGHAVQTTVRNPDRADWIAGPLTHEVVDVNKSAHMVIIVSGERDGWEAVGGHGIDKKNQQEVYLYQGTVWVGRG